MTTSLYHPGSIPPRGSLASRLLRTANGADAKAMFQALKNATWVYDEENQRASAIISGEGMAKLSSLYAFVLSTPDSQEAGGYVARQNGDWFRLDKPPFHLAYRQIEVDGEKNMMRLLLNGATPELLAQMGCKTVERTFLDSLPTPEMKQAWMMMASLKTKVESQGPGNSVTFYLSNELVPLAEHYFDNLPLATGSITRRTERNLPPPHFNPPKDRGATDVLPPNTVTFSTYQRHPHETRITMSTETLENCFGSALAEHIRQKHQQLSI